MKKLKQAELQSEQDLFLFVEQCIFRNPNLQDIQIVDFFQENQFVRFCALCQQTGFTFLSELQSELLQVYQSLSGIGARRMHLLHQKLLSLPPNVLTATAAMPDTGRPGIGEVFASIEFSPFRQYCEKQGIHYVDEITTQFLQAFATRRPWFSHHARIVEISQQYMPVNTQESVFDCGEIYPCIRNQPVMMISNKLQVPVQAPLDLLMCHIHGKQIKDIINGRTYGEWLELAEKLQQVQNLDKVLEQIWMSLSLQEQQLFLQKHEEAKSEREIAALWQCKTSRIRVALIEVQQKLLQVATDHRVHDALALQYASVPYVPWQELAKHFNKHIFLLRYLLIGTKSPFAYFEQLNLLFLRNKRSEIGMLVNKLENLPSICSKQVLLQELEQPLERLSLSIEDLQPFLNNLHYVTYGNIYAKQDKSMNSILSYIVDFCLGSDVESKNISEHIQRAFGPSYDSSWITSKHITYARSRLLTKAERLQKVKPVRKKVREVVNALLADLFEGMRQIRVKELYEVFQEELQKVKVMSANELCEILDTFQAPEVLQRVHPTSTIRYWNQRIIVVAP